MWCTLHSRTRVKVTQLCKFSAYSEKVPSYLAARSNDSMIRLIILFFLGWRFFTCQLKFLTVRLIILRRERRLNSFIRQVRAIITMRLNRENNLPFCSCCSAYRGYYFLVVRPAVHCYTAHAKAADHEQQYCSTAAACEKSFECKCQESQYSKGNQSSAQLTNSRFEAQRHKSHLVDYFRARETRKLHFLVFFQDGLMWPSGTSS